MRSFAGELAKRDPASLTAAQRFEHEYLQWVVDTQLFWLAEAEAPFRNPAWYIERLDPSMYLTREYAPLPKRLEGFLGYARAVPALAANIRANLRTPLPKAFIERGAAGFGGYADVLSQRDAGHLRAARRRKTEARAHRGNCRRGDVRWMS